MNSYQELVDFYSNQKSAYNEVSQELNSVQSEIRSIADVSDMDQYYAVVDETQEDYDEMYDRYYNGTDSETTASAASGMGGQQSVKLSELLKAEEKLTALKDAEDEIEDLFEEEARLESKLALYDEEKISDGLADAEENLTESKEDYNEFKSEFSETYGNVTDKEGMEESVNDALTSFDKAKLSLEKQETSYETALLNAQQKKESTDSTASNAQKEYNLQKIELDKKVSDAQEQYDTLVEELGEIKEAIGNDGVVTASCSGIISSLNIEVGDEISAGGGSSESMSFSSSSSAATLMTITDMSEVNISISISEDDILDIYLDQEAIVEIASFPDEKFDAVVDSISVEGATIGAASVSYTVNVSFTNDAGYELYDGMSADVTLVQGSARDCLYINDQAVTTKEGKEIVLLKGADGNGVETEVMTGFTDGQYVEIISGVNEGDTVLVQSALGGGAGGNSGMPDMGDFDMSNMPDMGNFDMSNMPDMGSFNPGEMMR
ncbi:MAG: HlyD family efflux transporter periplasmic adaptor subunit [Clostridia bacterium]|nr:HlyD family efflux transporter periplasmic adaptor subunit [Clostridia bacterium]MBQ7120638.1 HlyD family efflux transporter periplasmic adaptor subunit [Clostridia bacterium]